MKRIRWDRVVAFLVIACVWFLMIYLIARYWRPNYEVPKMRIQLQEVEYPTPSKVDPFMEPLLRSMQGKG